MEINMDKLETELADGTVYLKRSYGEKLNEVRNALLVLHWFIFQKSQQNAAWIGVGILNCSLKIDIFN